MPYELRLTLFCGEQGTVHDFENKENALQLWGKSWALPTDKLEFKSQCGDVQTV